MKGLLLLLLGKHCFQRATRWYGVTDFDSASYVPVVVALLAEDVVLVDVGSVGRQHVMRSLEKNTNTTLKYFKQKSNKPVRMATKEGIKVKHKTN